MTHTARLASLLLLSGAAVLAGAPAAAAEGGDGLGRLHGYRDWVIGCDNTRACEAQGYGREPEAESAGGRAALILRRDAGPGAHPTLHVAFGGMTGQERFPPHDRPITAQVGAQRFRLPPRGFKVEQLAVPPEQVAPLLAAALKAQAIVLSVDGVPWTVSLEGATAALLKMDDLQGRVGTPAALVRRGTQGEPVAPALPVVTPAPLPATSEADRRLEPHLRAALPHGAHDCPDADPQQPLAAVLRVSPTALLVVQACWRGAYQTGSRVLQLEDRAPHRAEALTLPQPDGSRADTLVVESLDVVGGRLSLYESAKVRGIGDCWATREWTWTAQGFVLVAATESPCRAFEAGGLPITLWRTRSP